MLLFMSTIVVALFIAGVMMSQLVKAGYLRDSENQLKNVAEDINSSMLYYDAGIFTRQDVARMVASKAAGNNVVIWIISSDGRPLMTADLEQTVVTQSEVAQAFQKMIDLMKQGNTVKWETWENNVFNTPVMTVGKPVIVSGEIQSYILVHKRINELNASLIDIYRQIVLSAAIAAALGIVLTYVFTRNMLRPLKVVSTGAQMMAKGNFDIYLEVHSRDEIGQFADSFNSVARELKKYESTRQSFVADVSHELRSPLTSMQGLVQGVLDGAVPEEEQKHYLGVVLDETRRLSLLITDLLDLTKIESGQFPLDIREIDINEMIRRSLVLFESKITGKKMNVEVLLSEGRVIVYADPNRMAQVLQNLIDNAIKFADEGGRLRIATLETDASVFVSINNSGEVIPREDLPYIFDRFYKADKARSRAREGTGIGLSLVKKILEEHRQKIWVESDAVALPLP